MWENFHTFRLYECRKTFSCLASTPVSLTALVRLQLLKSTVQISASLLNPRSLSLENRLRDGDWLKPLSAFSIKSLAWKSFPTIWTRGKRRISKMEWFWCRTALTAAGSSKTRDPVFNSNHHWKQWNHRFSGKLVNTPLHSIEGDSTRMNLSFKKRMNWQQSGPCPYRSDTSWRSKVIENGIGSWQWRPCKKFLQNSENISKWTVLAGKLSETLTNPITTLSRAFTPTSNIKVSQ